MDPEQQSNLAQEAGIEPAPCHHCAAFLQEVLSELRLLRDQVAKLASNPGQGTVLDLNEAAAFLRTSRRSVERKIASGQLHAAKLSPGQQGAVRVTKSELERFLEQRTRSR